MRYDILDHGYVQLVESWGSDERIIEAARMSTNKGFKGWPADEKLLRYLYEHKHMTPFEMAGLIVEVQAPLFVFREWHRHRTQSYNEMSARYTPMPDVNYIPSTDRLMGKGRSASKQAGKTTDREVTTEDALQMQAAVRCAYEDAQAAYTSLLHSGAPKELARLVIPVGRYSRMRASANLRNWLAFLTLRLDENAQWEIQEYAQAVGYLIADAFPRTWALFADLPMPPADVSTWVTP